MFRFRRGISAGLCVALLIAPTTAMADGLSDISSAKEMPSDVVLTTGILEDRSDDESYLLQQPQEQSEDVDAQVDEELPQPEEQPEIKDEIALFFNGDRIALGTEAINTSGTVYIPMRDFFNAMGCVVSWESCTGYVRASRDDFWVRFEQGSELVIANGRYFYMNAPLTIINGVAMIPARVICKLFTAEVVWDGVAKTISFTGGQILQSAEQYYNAEDLLWLSKIINAESGNQPLEGKIAVGNVVLNRVESYLYPDTIHGVVFDRKYGVQFTPAYNGSIYNTASEQSVLAAKLCLEGEKIVPDDCMYFLNTVRNPNSWIVRTKSVFANIGAHSFFCE